MVMDLRLLEISANVQPNGIEVPHVKVGLPITKNPHQVAERA